MTGINSENDPEAFARALAVLERNGSLSCALRRIRSAAANAVHTQQQRTDAHQADDLRHRIRKRQRGARSRLTRIGLDMQGNFKKIGVESVLMDGKRATFPAARAVFTWTTMRRLSLSGRGCRKPDCPQGLHRARQL